MSLSKFFSTTSEFHYINLPDEFRKIAQLTTSMYHVCNTPFYVMVSGSHCDFKGDALRPDEIAISLTSLLSEGKTPEKIIHGLKNTEPGMRVPMDITIGILDDAVSTSPPNYQSHQPQRG